MTHAEVNSYRMELENSKVKGKDCPKPGAVRPQHQDPGRHKEERLRETHSDPGPGRGNLFCATSGVPILRGGYLQMMY